MSRNLLRAFPPPWPGTPTRACSWSAGADVRPATALVYVDAALRVLDAAGNVISESLDEYVAATAGTIIPALYISDAETAAALKFYLIESRPGRRVRGRFYENAALVKDVADLNPVRGLIDFRASPRRTRTSSMKSSPPPTAATPRSA